MLDTYPLGLFPIHMDITTAYPSRVAEAVREAITSSGVTIVWLCDITGIPRTTLVRRLGGHAPFSVAELDAIASALRVPVTTFTALEQAAS